MAAFVRGARNRGARCLEGVRVTAVHRENGRVTGVATDAGDIRADFVVNCAGLWGRDNRTDGGGSTCPSTPASTTTPHTEKIPDLPADLPTLRDYDIAAYIREDAGSLLVGAFEPVARPIDVSELPADFCFDELPGHAEEQLMPVLEDAMHRIPVLGEIGWRSFFCGPESFTPDDQFISGRRRDCATSSSRAASTRSGSSPGAGSARRSRSGWIGGTPPSTSPATTSGGWSRSRTPGATCGSGVSETLGLLYARHYPYRQYETARNVRHSPLHERLAARGACFGETAGWERPNWYAPPGVEPVYEYSFGRQNWFEHSAAEHRAAREGVALFDQSSFTKYLVEGRDATAVLQRVCTANVDVEPGRIVYTPLAERTGRHRGRPHRHPASPSTGTGW